MVAGSFSRKLRRMDTRTKIILGAVIVAVIVVGGYLVSNAMGKSPEQMKREVAAANAAITGWRVKNDARLEVNKGKVMEFKQKLMNYYDPESGALAEQQRLINALVSADQAAATDDSSGEKVLGFDITNVKFNKVDVSATNAKLTADIEYYIRYETQRQNYSTFGKNRVKWELKKEGKDWKVIKEEVIPGDDNT